MIRLLTALYGLVMDTVASVLEWLRRPGSKLKLVCGVLAFGCLVSGMAAFEREQRIRTLGQQIITITAECKTRTEELADQVAERDARVAERDARLATIASALRAEADKLKALQAENAAALEQLARKIEAAENDAQAWRDRYESRAPSCEAALQALDAACPELKGY